MQHRSPGTKWERCSRSCRRKVEEPQRHERGSRLPPRAMKSPAAMEEVHAYAFLRTRTPQALISSAANENTRRAISPFARQHMRRTNRRTTTPIRKMTTGRSSSAQCLTASGSSRTRRLGRDRCCIGTGSRISHEELGRMPPRERNHSTVTTPSRSCARISSDMTGVFPSEAMAEPQYQSSWLGRA